MEPNQDLDLARSPREKEKQSRTQALLQITPAQSTSYGTNLIVPDSPKPCEASGGSGYEPTPSAPTFGAAGARCCCPGPSTRALRKRTVKKEGYSFYANGLEDGR